MKIKPKTLCAVIMLAALIPLQACSPVTGSQPGTDPATSPSTTASQTTPPSTTIPSTTAPSTTALQTTPQTNGGQTVNYQVLHTIPAALKSSVDGLKKDRGYFFFAKEQILVVFMGERSTGGYSIALKSIQLQADTLSVEVIEKSPKPGEMVTEAFTYPMLILQLDQDFKTFAIKDQTGKAYPHNQGTQY